MCGPEPKVFLNARAYRNFLWTVSHPSHPSPKLLCSGRMKRHSMGPKRAPVICKCRSFARFCRSFGATVPADVIGLVARSVITFCVIGRRWRRSRLLELAAFDRLRSFWRAPSSSSRHLVPHAFVCFCSQPVERRSVSPGGTGNVNSDRRVLPRHRTPVTGVTGVRGRGGLPTTDPAYTSAPITACFLGFSVCF